VSCPSPAASSPAWENTATNVSQDYVYSWTRDAAITAIELAAGPLPTTQPLIDYVQFAQTCQNSVSSIGHFDRASFLINGTPRNWTDQTDGPALQTLAILRLYAQLDAPTQATANAVIAANLNFLQNAYQGQTYNLWEEEYGASFFARSVQLQCFQAITANTAGINVPANFAELYYWLAGEVTTAGTVPLDSLSAGFFSQVGVDASTTPGAAAAALQAVGDQMLQAVIFHSDNLELSEQFDATTGYEKSVSNLSWSYASFLSAVRARTAI
jgi:GH15 family glucan-1,4-alpha-glucosidase